MDNMFGEDNDFEETLHLIMASDYEDATNVRDELNYNSDWYNYSILTFDYKGDRYSIEYKEHTSDNVSDFSFVYETFVKLGPAKEMNESITMEEMARTRNSHRVQVERMQRELDNLKKILRPLKFISNDNISTLVKMFSDDADNEQKMLIGEFFELIEEGRQRGY